MCSYSTSGCNVDEAVLFIGFLICLLHLKEASVLVSFRLARWMTGLSKDFYKTELRNQAKGSLVPVYSVGLERSLVCYRRMSDRVDGIIWWKERSLIVVLASSLKYRVWVWITELCNSPYFLGRLKLQLPIKWWKSLTAIFLTNDILQE
jgi:hypothetical protein